MSVLEFVPYEKRYKYPGMAPLDKEIWERFILAHPSAFSRCAYHVAVGGGTEMDTNVNAQGGGDVNKLYQRKIDVVGETPEALVVVEVKPRASTSAIGQVKGYVRLLARDYEINQPIRAVVLTDELLPDVEFIAKEEGVQILVA